MGTIFFRSIILFGFWILLSGKLDVFHLALGLVGSVFIAWRSIEHTTQKGLSFLVAAPVMLGRMLAYVIWLLGQIILAAIHVTKLILSPNLKINPKLIKHKTRLKTDLEHLIFANSITLTPGTITTDISEHELTIHELDHSSSEGIRSGKMEKRIAKIHKDKNK